MPAEKIAYYRGRCLECHAERGCSLNVGAQSVQNQNDNCIGCHMPRASSSDIAHGAASNHRIPRAVAEENPSTAGAGRIHPDKRRLLLSTAI